MRCTTALTLLLLLGNACLHAQPEPPRQPQGSAISVTWTAPGQPAARGLVLTEISPAGLVKRYLVQTPLSQRLSLTYQYAAREGRTTYKLVDGATGWVMAAETVSELKFKDFDESIDQAVFIEKLLARDHSQTLTLWTSATPKVGFRSTTKNDNFIADAVADFASRDLLAKVASAAPPGVLEGVAFIEVLVTLEGQIPGTELLREPAALFSAALQAGGAKLPAAYDGLEWETNATEAYTEIHLDGAQAEFARGFPGVTAADPLAGEHLN